MEWIRFTKRNPCPVCNGERSDCRQNEKTKLIHCRASISDSFDYINRGPDAIGFEMWAHRSTTEEWSEERRREWEEQKTERKRLKEEESERWRQVSLTAEQRHAQITKILNQLSLTEAHRKKLHARGLTDAQIDRANYRSIVQWQPLREPVSDRLSGVNQWGSALNNKTPGILVPVPDENGYYVLLRVNDLTPKTENKYYPCSSASRGVKIHLPNNEQPIAVYHPPTPPMTPRIGFVEGLEYKPYLAAERLRVPVIGAAGGNFATSRKAIEAAIAFIKKKYGWDTVEFVLYADAGSAVNSNVSENYQKLGRFIPELAIADWGQLTNKEGQDIDEIKSLSAVKLITLDQFKSQTVIDPKKANLIRNRLLKEVKNLAKKTKNFFTQSGEEEDATKFTGSREEIWLKTIGEGFAVLDESFMGDGKSHAVPNIRNSRGRIWYVSESHRNPSIPAIAEGFADLMPRTQYGFYRDENNQLKEANENTLEENLEIKPNCIRANMFRELTGLGYDPNEISPDGVSENTKTNPVCNACPLAGACGETPGMYVYERRQTLSQARIRCDLNSMPRDIKQYGNDIIVFEEPSRAIASTRIIQTNWSKLLLELDRMRQLMPPSLFETLDTVIQSLRDKWNNEEKYGLNHQQILSGLSLPLETPQLGRFLGVHSISLGDIFQPPDRIYKHQFTQQEWKTYRDAVIYANWEDRKNTFKKTREELDKLPPNALYWLIQGLTQRDGISLRLLNGELSIIIDIRDQYQFVGGAYGLIFLDATRSSDRLKELIHVNRPIKAIKRDIKAPLKNLTVQVIRTLGIGTRTRSRTAYKRLHKIAQWIETHYGDSPTIDYLHSKLDTDGDWFVHSRGSNDFAGSQNLTVIGLPNPNVGALEDEYYAYNGTLDGFEEFYRQRVNDEIRQLTGRQRVQRYPDHQFNLFFIAPPDTDLEWLKKDGATVHYLDAVEIDPEAGDRYQTALLNIARGILETGEKTISGLAKKLGRYREGIHKFLRENGLTWDQIVKRVEQMICKLTLNNNSKGEFTPEDLVNAFRDLLRLDPIELAVEVVNAIATMGWDDFVRYVLDAMPEPLQHRILGILYSISTTDEQNAIANSS